MKPSHYFPVVHQERMDTDPSFSIQLNLQGLGPTPLAANSGRTGYTPIRHQPASRKHTAISNGQTSERSHYRTQNSQGTMPSFNTIDQIEVEEPKKNFGRSRQNSKPRRKYTGGSAERGVGKILHTEELALGEAEQLLEGHKRTVTEGPIDEKQFRYTRQRMMFIPQNIGNISTGSAKAKPFLTFNELSKTALNSHSKMLEDILKKGASIKQAPKKGDQISFAPRDPGQLDVVRNILKFNKIQKANYIRQIRTEEEKTLSPLKQMQEIQERKLKTMPPVRIISSRKIHHQVFDFVEKKPDNNSALPTLETAPDEKSRLFDHQAVKILEPKTPLVKGLNFQNVSNVVSVSDELGLYAGSPGWKFFWYSGKNNREKWKPDAREGHTLTTVGKAVVLYGGIGNKLFDKIQVFDPAKENWTTPEMNGEIPKEGRHGHTACEYKGSMWIFGGEKTYNHDLGFRESLNDVYKFNAERCEWKFIKSLGKSMDGRRNHAAVIHNKVMYVYGGIGTDNRTSKDVYSFGLKSQMWNQMFPMGNREFGQAYHTMCACFNDKTDRNKKRAAEEGLYVFGGKDQEGRILSTFKYLALNGKEGEWKYPKIAGTPPAARYGHSMVFYQTLQLLLIYGGKNETLYERNKEINLNDIKILNLETMSWGVSCSTGLVPKIGRAQHAAVMYRTSMLIFGGVAFGEYASPDLKKVEINQMSVKSLINEYTEEDSEENETIVKKIAGSPKKRILKRQDSEEPEVEKTEPKGFVSFLPLPPKNQQSVEEKLAKLRNTIRNVTARGGGISPLKGQNFPPQY